MRIHRQIRHTVPECPPQFLCRLCQGNELVGNDIDIGGFIRHRYQYGATETECFAQRFDDFIKMGIRVIYLVDEKDLDTGFGRSVPSELSANFNSGFTVHNNKSGIGDADCLQHLSGEIKISRVSIKIL